MYLVRDGRGGRKRPFEISGGSLRRRMCGVVYTYVVLRRDSAHSFPEEVLVRTHGFAFMFTNHSDIEAGDRNALCCEHVLSQIVFESEYRLLRMILHAYGRVVQTVRYKIAPFLSW